MHNGFYINLESRADRRELFEAQFADISGFAIQRFNAIHNSNGAFGCILSHIACLEAAKQNDWDYVLLFEDDFERIVPPDVFKARIEALLKNPWDVMMLSGYVLECSPPNNGMCRLWEAQTTVAYMVRKEYYDTLLANYREACLGIHDRTKYHIYALDQYWKRLQSKGNWYISYPILGKQRVGYSDIERRAVNYDVFFLHSNINKRLLPHL